MKKFVLITWGIAGIGGGQIYTNNRCKYYKDCGYDVYVCHLLDGDILLPGLDTIRHILIPELRFNVGAFSRRRVKRIVKRISDFVGYSDEDDILVESNSIAQAQWAELLAKTIHAKHFYYILGEHDRADDEILTSFAMFKIKRGEIAGITDRSVPNLVKASDIIRDGREFRIVAPLRVEVVDYAVPVLNNLSPVDYTIGVMARLEKLFVRPTLASLASYCKKHHEKTFRIIVVGDTEKASVKEQIKSLFSDIPNVIILMVGYLSPIPRKYVDICDLCISSSGCASITNFEGTLTISIDAKDCQPIGILGFTTKESVFRKDEPIAPLGDLLDEIFIEKKYPYHREKTIRNYTIQNLMQAEVDYINNSCLEKEYFDFSNAFNWQSRKRGIKERLYQFVKDKFGSKAIRVIHKISHPKY